MSNCAKEKLRSHTHHNPRKVLGPKISLVLSMSHTSQSREYKGLIIAYVVHSMFPYTIGLTTHYNILSHHDQSITMVIAWWQRKSNNDSRNNNLITHNMTICQNNSSNSQLGNPFALHISQFISFPWPLLNSIVMLSWFHFRYFLAFSFPMLEASRYLCLLL
jgi:hypothetical protein